MKDRSNGNDVSHHILPASATMVGVCVTVVSLVRLLETSAEVSTIIDNIMAVDSVSFLASAVLSYLALRTERETRRLERWADLLFLAGLCCMVVASFMLAWEFHYALTPRR